MSDLVLLKEWTNPHGQSLRGSQGYTGDRNNCVMTGRAEPAMLSTHVLSAPSLEVYSCRLAGSANQLRRI